MLVGRVFGPSEAASRVRPSPWCDCAVPINRKAHC